MKLTVIFMLLCMGICRSFPSTKALPQVKDDNHWSYLIFAQFWPESSCTYFKEEGDECYIPPNVKGWTVHGLWPSRPDSTVYPNNCNDSMPFDIDQIQALRSKLDLEWHYYKKGADPTYLWCHEWTKHGTCAYSLPDLRGELKYFNKTLELHSHISLEAALSNSNVTPSDTKTYKRDDFFNAVLKYYKVKPYIVCDWDKKARKAYIDQIYLCYNKTFGLQDCYPTPSKKEVDVFGNIVYGTPSYYDKCMEKDNIFYIPFNKSNRKTENTNKSQSSSLIFKSEDSCGRTKLSGIGRRPRF